MNYEKERQPYCTLCIPAIVSNSDYPDRIFWVQQELRYLEPYQHMLILTLFPCQGHLVISDGISHVILEYCLRNSDFLQYSEHLIICQVNRIEIRSME
jgi:hypothetical protein